MTLSVKTNTPYVPNVSYYGEMDDDNIVDAVLYKGATKIDIYNYDFIGMQVEKIGDGYSKYAPNLVEQGYKNYSGLYVDEYNMKPNIEIECCVAQVPEFVAQGQLVPQKTHIVTDVNTDKLNLGNTYVILVRVPHLPWFCAFNYNNITNNIQDKLSTSTKCCLWRAAEYVANSETPFWPDKKSLQYMLEYQKLKSR